MEPVRLQKYLSRAGVASRRHAETLIVDGRVRVNGRIVTELGTKVDGERDSVTVDGEPVRSRAAAWIAFHKPRRTLCTRHDPQGRTTVYDLLPAGMRTLFTVGRLDADSEGLLLLTNDGDAANRMLHPRYGTEREYEVAVRGAVGDAALASLEAGVVLEDGPARVERVKRLPSREHGASRLRLVLKEGRKHEVRRLLEAVGHPVVRLRRIRYGPIKLGVLPIGEWRPLTEREMESLHVGQRIDPEDDVVRRETGARRERLTDERKGREWRSGSGES